MEDQEEVNVELSSGFKKLVNSTHFKSFDKTFQEQLLVEMETLRKGNSLFHTSFEIKVPTALPSEFGDKIYITLDNPLMDLFWCKFGWEDRPKKAVNDLYHNYDIELSTSEKWYEPDTIYLFVSNELDKCFQKTKRYKYLGLVVVSNYIICRAWMHPLFREKHFMSSFLKHYCIDDGLLILKSPVTDKMQNCLDSVIRFISNDKESLEKFSARLAKYYYDERNNILF